VLRVTPIPCLEDNYAYLLDDASGELAVVDPSDAEPVLEAIARNGGTLTAVLATHHHDDHVGGIVALLEGARGGAQARARAASGTVPVYGGAIDRGRIPLQTNGLADGEVFTWGNTAVRALHVPGHTRGAMAYVAEDAVLTGDTLFIAGCGRLFEGTPEMMHRSLNEVLGALPPSTRVYCGHEYTVANLQFAQSVEPDNVATTELLARARQLRAEQRPTVGSTLAVEHACNPFFRCDRATIRGGLGLDPDASELATFAALRRAKDGYRAPGG
jgi:hydroxyacylglutathione hydrolase